MQISVLIPVYNAASFIEQSVISALSQPEVAEVVLVEDGSLDNSLAVCTKLNEDHARVKLYQHPQGGNRGAGASRNLAIQQSKCEIVAFLDADDYYLPGRFSQTVKILQNDISIDGVYEAAGYHHDSAVASNSTKSARLTTMKKKCSPEILFEEQAPIGRSGHCCTLGWTVRKKIFSKSGLFDENLKLHQDTAMFVKFAAVGRMAPGNLEKPVAVRRVHANNRITAPRSPEKIHVDRMRMWHSLWLWARKRNDLKIKRKVIILKCFLKCHLAGPKGDINKRSGAIKRFFKLRRLITFIPYLFLTENTHTKKST